MSVQFLNPCCLTNKSRRADAGFTLIEALVALAIASSALVILAGRLGASSDIQYSLSSYALASDIAANELAKQMLFPESLREKKYQVQLHNQTYDVRSWYEKTEVDGFIRRNISVNSPDESELMFFIYQEIY